MVEIAEIAYSLSTDRCAPSVQYWGSTILLAMYMKQIIGETPMSMSLRKMYGLYFHNIFTHAPILYRIRATRSLLSRMKARHGSYGSWLPIPALVGHSIVENALMRATYQSDVITPQRSDRLVTREAQSTWLTLSPNRNWWSPVNLSRLIFNAYLTTWPQVKVSGMNAVMAVSYIIMV